MSRSLARQELVQLLECNFRGAEASRGDVERLCALAREHNVASVCVNGSRIVQAIHFLDGSNVKVTCAVAFPLGACDADVKRYETEVAVDGGAHLIEMAANIGRLKDGDDAYVTREFRDVVEAADERAVSVYLNTMLLTPDEIRRASDLAAESDVKGITVGGGPNINSTVEAVKLVRETVGDSLGIKVDQDEFDVPAIVNLLNAGATRFGLVNVAQVLKSLGQEFPEVTRSPS